MMTFFGTFIRIFLDVFRSKRIVLPVNALLKKENEILLRRVRKNRVQFDTHDKLFFNSQRPHQGIQKRIPKQAQAERTVGAIRKGAVLDGLHHHYFRQAA